jgi:hypothetical protein
MSLTIAGAGWHDVCVRWDISTPQAVVGRLNALPGQGNMRQPGKKLFAERDRFGKWQHALGPAHVLLAYVVDSPEHGLIRRLELQTHLVDEVENDLCRPSEFPSRWERVQRRMAMQGVLPPEDPVYVRVDPAVDVVYDNPGVGRDVLEALRHARWPYGWYAEFQGAPRTQPSRSRQRQRSSVGSTAAIRSFGTETLAGASFALSESSASNGAIKGRCPS